MPPTRLTPDRNARPAAPLPAPLPVVSIEPHLYGLAVDGIHSNGADEPTDVALDEGAPTGFPSNDGDDDSTRLSPLSRSPSPRTAAPVAVEPPRLVASPRSSAPAVPAPPAAVLAVPLPVAPATSKPEVRAGAGLEARVAALACMNDSGVPSLPLLLPVDSDFAGAFSTLLADSSAKMACAFIPCCEAVVQCRGEACSLDRRAVNLTLSSLQFKHILPALKLAAAVVKVDFPANLLFLMIAYEFTLLMLVVRPRGVAHARLLPSPSSLPRCRLEHSSGEGCKLSQRDPISSQQCCRS
jgi:hypothetical protein